MRNRIQKRHVLALLVIVAVIAAIRYTRKSRKPARESYDAVAQSIVPSDLCKRCFEDREFGYVVRMTFRLPLTPTADPLVWEYRPGLPSSAFAPTIRIHFEKPVDPMPHNIAIVGIVDRIITDLQTRQSGHHGVVVISEARHALEAAP